MELRSVQLGFEEVEVKCYQHSLLLGDDPMNPNTEQVHLSHWMSHHAKEFLKRKTYGGEIPTNTTTAAHNTNTANNNSHHHHQHAVIVR
jgi:Tfp pilus assembly major pilin PilA